MLLDVILEDRYFLVRIFKKKLYVLVKKDRPVFQQVLTDRSI